MKPSEAAIVHPHLGFGDSAAAVLWNARTGHQPHLRPGSRGDAAIIFDPGIPQSLLDALDQVRIESVRQDLIAKGFERVKMFTWDRTAQQIAEEVLGGRKGFAEQRN